MVLAYFVLVVLWWWSLYGLTCAATTASTTAVSQAGQTQATDQIKIVKQALEYVKSMNATNCSDGTGKTLSLNFDHNAWIHDTVPAVKTANFLSSIIALDGNLNRFAEDVLYAMVRNNVHGNDIIYGSAIAVEPGVISGKPKYSPYAKRNRANETVEGFDIASSYDYQANSTQWYTLARDMDMSNITVVTDKITFNESDSVTENVYVRQPQVTYLDGKWTYPYFDCGGGNIWMSTYASPIIALSDDLNRTFRGVATIDIELTNLNINQCDSVSSDSGQDDDQTFDIFRGTHSCQETTTCVALNLGFRAGAYNCVCQDGFYFPNTSATVKAFRGSDIEEYLEVSNSSTAPQFQCLPCARGCEVCVDSQACLYEINVAVQVIVITIISIMIVACAITCAITWRNRKQLVIKSASPTFLLLMCFGAVLMCCSVYVMYGEVTTLTCTIQIWPFNLGFTVMYGAVIFKTWRISVIFKSGGATKRVSLPDKTLLQRMAPLVGIVAVYLAVWTAISPPEAVTEKTSNDLKFFVCRLSWWAYAMYGMEALMLLVGVYLCFTVRKAPAHFNESKFITWATYNAIILGSFVIMLTQVVGLSVGPDTVYVLLMLQQQVFVTIAMVLIFAPKFWTLYRGGGVSGESVVYSNHVMTVTGRVKPNLAAATSRFNNSMAASTKSVGVQCNQEDFLHDSGYQDEERLVRKRSLAWLSSHVSPVHSSTLAPLQICIGGHQITSEA